MAGKRGNPYHWPKGSPKGGQFAPKGATGTINIRQRDNTEEKQSFQDEYGFECRMDNGNYHFGLRGKPPKTYTFYGEEYDEKKVKPIRNSMSTAIPKPTGGIWLSPSNSPWGWKDWCKAEEFRDCPDSEKQTFSLNGAKVLHIYDTNDLNQIGARKDDYGTYFPDFEELAKHYDAMEVHYSQGEGLTRGLYGWDCDSLLVFNPKVLGKKHENDSV